MEVHVTNWPVEEALVEAVDGLMVVVLGLGVVVNRMICIGLLVAEVDEVVDEVVVEEGV